MEHNNNIDRHLLDDFLQGKVEEAEFSYHESYWQKMSAILDGEEKKKRFPFFWRGLSILIGIIVVGVGAYLLPKLSNKKHKEQAKQEFVASPTNTQNRLPSVKQDTPGNEKENEKGNKNENDHSNSQLNTQSNLSTTNANSSSSSNSNDLNTSDKPISDAKNSLDESNSNIYAPMTSRKKQRTLKNSQLGATVLEKNKSVQKKSSEAGNAKNDNAIPNKTNESLDNKKGTSDDIAKLSNEKAVNSTTNNVTVLGRNMKPIDTIQYVRKQALDPAVSNPRYLSSLSNYLPEKLDSVTVITYQPVATSKPIELAPLQANESEKVKIKYRFEWNVLAGLNLNKGFRSTLSNPNSWAVSPYIGGGIEKQMLPKLTLASHIGFTYFNGLNSEIKVSSNQYGFGLDSSTFSVAHKKLLQLYLPISVYYEVLKNHYVMASLGMSYSFDVSSKVIEQSMSNNTGYSTMNTKSVATTTSTQSGYSTGFNQMDVYAQIGYSYKLFSNIMLQCSFQQGFFDMTKNSYFSNTIRNTQSRISIGLKYNFKRN